MLRRLVLCLLFLGAAGVASAQPVYTPPSGSGPGSQCNGVGQSPVWSGSAWSCGTLFLLARTTADRSTTSGTSYADVTGLTFAVSANTNYAFHCDLTYQTAATTTAARMAMNGPASPTAVQITHSAFSNGTTAFSGSVTAYDTDFGVAGGPGATSVAYQMFGVIENGANAGTVAVRFKSEVDTSSLTIMRGSYCNAFPIS